MRIYRDPRFGEVRNRRVQFQRMMDGKCSMKQVERIISHYTDSGVDLNRYMKSYIRCDESTLDLALDKKTEFPYERKIQNSRLC